MNLKRISAFIARVGESPAFVAAMAHCWFAFSVIAIMAHVGISAWVTGPLCVAAAAGKEFYFDLRYEKTPPQTWQMSALDFVGYLTGIALAVLIYR